MYDRGRCIACMFLTSFDRFLYYDTPSFIFATASKAVHRQFIVPSGMVSTEMSSSGRKQTNKGALKKKAGQKIELSEEQIRDIKDAFSMFDVDDTGFMDSKNIKVALRALGFEPKKEEIKKLVLEIDKEGTGQIQYEDFLHVMARKISEKDANEEIMKAFRLFDDDQTGKISFKNLKRVAAELGENLTDVELKEMIAEADRDEDGEINQEEFLRIMKKTSLY